PIPYVPLPFPRLRPSSSSSSTSRAVAAGVGREWCHSYDLSKQLGEQGLVARGGALELLDCSCSSTSTFTSLPLSGGSPSATPSPLSRPSPSPPPPCRGPYDTADAHAAGFLASLTPGGAGAPAAAAGGVGRLVIESAGSLAWARAAAATAAGGGGDREGQQDMERLSEQGLMRLLYNVRQRVQQSKCAVLVTVPAGLLSPGCSRRLPHLADSVWQLEGLADDSQLHRLLPDPN
ncbi:hypothetical protein Agub_g1409, partial [Astrephomene gubernaculifera]